MRLLLIEDDIHIARELMLRWRDGERLALHAPTLADADAALAQAAFDIVLLDLGLPDGDGMDWLVAYRQRDPQGAVLAAKVEQRNGACRELRGHHFLSLTGETHAGVEPP